MSDFSHAIRGLRRSPALVAIAILSLALRIGTNATVFSVVRETILDDLSALGAEARDAAWMILRRTPALAAAGIAISVIIAAFATRALTKLLFEVKPTDGTTFLAVALLLAAVALSAGWIPARRATRVDPTVAPRYE